MLPVQVRKRQISRIMTQSATKLNHNVTAQHYIELYEEMLRRPLIYQKAHTRNGKAKQHKIGIYPVEDHIDPISVVPPQTNYAN